MNDYSLCHLGGNVSAGLTRPSHHAMLQAVSWLLNMDDGQVRATSSGGSRKWHVTREAFQRLLAVLGDDHHQAALRYEGIRTRLIKYFAWERCPYPEEHADEVFDRVARRIAEGESLANPEAYFRGVARLLVKEIGADLRRRSQVLDEIGRAAARPVAIRDSEDHEAHCLETCLDRLPAESRGFILRYYEGDKQTRIAGRKALALQLGIPLNALRNRALRLRGNLERCVRQYLERRKEA